MQPTTTQPTSTPTPKPITSHPTTIQPIAKPTTKEPSSMTNPTNLPSTIQPTMISTSVPTFLPTTSKPSNKPTMPPTTAQPTNKPTPIPSFKPTTSKPSNKPTVSPTTAQPTNLPTTLEPSTSPTNFPSSSQHPSSDPINIPSIQPSNHPTTLDPTLNPSFEPTSFPPTNQPTDNPTNFPSTMLPTHHPTTVDPTFNPTVEPTTSPSEKPIIPTTVPSLPFYPTLAPVKTDPGIPPNPTRRPSSSAQCLLVAYRPVAFLVAALHFYIAFQWGVSHCYFISATTNIRDQSTELFAIDDDDDDDDAMYVHSFGMIVHTIKLPISHQWQWEVEISSPCMTDATWIYSAYHHTRKIYSFYCVSNDPVVWLIRYYVEPPFLEYKNSKWTEDIGSDPHATGIRFKVALHPFIPVLLFSCALPTCQSLFLLFSFNTPPTIHHKNFVTLHPR